MSGVWTRTSERIIACPVKTSLIARDCAAGESIDAATHATSTTNDAIRRSMAWLIGSACRSDQRAKLPVGRVQQRLVIGRGDRAIAELTRDDEQVLRLV